jgi:hypothetical protein
MDGTCSNQPQDPHTQVLYRTFYQLKLICATGWRYVFYAIAFSLTSFRRALARKHLKRNEIPLTLTSFPRLGVPGPFTEPYFDPANAVSSHSLFLPEEITNPHVRFPSVRPLDPLVGTNAASGP